MIFSSAPFIRKMRKNLQDFKSDDYILCTGDPAIIGLSTAIASDITQGKFNLLKWDRQEKRYYPLDHLTYMIKENSMSKIIDFEQDQQEINRKNRYTNTVSLLFDATKLRR